MPESLPCDDQPTLSVACGPLDQKTTPPLPPGDLPAGTPAVPDYEIEGELGRGGMGVVYRARQVKLNRLVALKMVLAGGHASAADLLRFKAEAEAVARLQHPNIVQIHEVGESEGRPFFSLEFVPGGSLAARLDGTPWPPRQAAALVQTLARAMHAAHAQGIVHRDLKPANVLLASDGTPKVTDFGLAKQMDSQHGQTQTGAVLGTPSYMAPEQASGKGREVGPAADVYSLGAVLYELLTGRPPFRAETPLDTILQVVSEEPVPPRRLVPKLPRDLETICLKCLEKVPARRYATAADLADDLGRWLSTQPIRARRIGPAGRAARWCRRNPLLAAVCALAALVIVTISAIYYASLLRENQLTRDARDQAERQRDQADAAREQAQDTLARGLYEQARALRLAHQPGWRWRALDLLRQAERLRGRPRRADLPPVEEADQPGMSARLPQRGELRREAAAALLLQDARPSPPVAIAASTGFYREISKDGRHVLAAFTRMPQKPGQQPDAGLRLYDLRDGRLLRELRLPMIFALAVALSPDSTFLAVATPGKPGVELIELSEGKPRRTLPALRGPTPLRLARYDSLEFSPDGRYLAAAHGDGKKMDLLLWDLRDPAASRHLARVDTPAPSFAFRPDGRVLAYTVGGNKIGLVDVPSRGQPKVFELPLPVAPARAATTPSSSRRQRLAWGSRSLLAVACASGGKGTVLFWDAERQADQGRWDGDFDLKTLRTAFSPDGKRLAAADGGGSIRVWDLAAGAEALRLEAVHPGGAGALQWLTDSRLLSGDFFGNSYTAWEISGPAPSSVQRPAREGIEYLTFSPDGRRLAVLHGRPRPDVVLIERESGQVAHQLVVPAGLKPVGVRFRADGRQLALLAPRQAVVWDLPECRPTTHSMAAPAGWQRQFYEAAFLDDGRLLVVDQKGKDNRLRLSVRDVVSGREVGPGVSIALGQGWNPAAGGVASSLRADGRLLVTTPVGMLPSRDAISIWDVSSGTRLAEMTSAEPAFVLPAMGAGLSPDGKWLAQMISPSNDVLSLDVARLRLRIWDVANHRHHWDVRFSGAPAFTLFSPDGRLLAVSYENGNVEVWDVRDRELLFGWRALGAAVKRLAFTPDSAFLAYSGSRGPVHLLHLGELRRRLADMGLDW